MEMKITWQLKEFQNLTPLEIYEILQLRSEVFVVEQNCIFLDADNNDQLSFHLQGRIDEKLIAYVRIIPPGHTYNEPSIGRVVSSPSHRKKGVGIELMKKAIEETTNLFGIQPIVIGAQLYLKKFYENLGFTMCSDIYMEDDIQHIKMIRKS